MINDPIIEFRRKNLSPNFWKNWRCQLNIRLDGAIIRKIINLFKSRNSSTTFGNDPIILQFPSRDLSQSKLNLILSLIFFCLPKSLRSKIENKLVLIIHATFYKCLVINQRKKMKKMKASKADMLSRNL